MPNNQLRKHYLLDRWVVIAAQRKKRPTDFAKAKEKQPEVNCPFCIGNEHMTPPATLVYIEKSGNIISEKDLDNFRHKGWVVRCFPNLYPAFTPIQGIKTPDSKERFLESIDAVGHHEVIVESPRHEEHPDKAPIKQLRLVIHAYQDRLNDFYCENSVKYVSIFRNHGAEAGASLSHPHTQIIATPIVPRLAIEENGKSLRYWETNHHCILCDIVSSETNNLRFIWENNGFVVLAPWASIHPFEFWIIPKRHQSTILEMTRDENIELAETMRVSFGALSNFLSDPPYNFGFHMSRENHHHWHLEVYPKLTTWAGFEKSTDMYINIVSPEEAALNLRKFAAKEYNTIGGHKQN